MKKFGYVLTNPAAARDQAVLRMLGIASGFKSKVSLSNERKTFALSDLMKRIPADMHCGDKVTVTVEGQDEEAAVAALQNYFVSCM
ncbi:MAG: HPr family phosphocarrier protein [Clostridia bacterium]|nr:HPr family phosphocarrier protein [Clostridia bacterium]